MPGSHVVGWGLWSPDKARAWEEVVVWVGFHQVTVQLEQLTELAEAQRRLLHLMRAMITQK